MKAYFFLFGIVILATSCQHKTPSSTAIDATIGAEDFKAYATQTQPQEQWSSKARIKALGGVYIPQHPIPSVKNMFGMNFNEAKKLVRILDVRASDKFLESNFSMNKDIKVPVVNIPLPHSELDRELSAKNISKDSIIIVVCNSENTSNASQALHSLGYSRVLNFRETGKKDWQYSCE